MPGEVEALGASLAVCTEKPAFRSSVLTSVNWSESSSDIAKHKAEKRAYSSYKLLADHVYEERSLMESERGNLSFYHGADVLFRHKPSQVCIDRPRSCRCSFLTAFLAMRYALLSSPVA
jgi:hypothetical protein